jgi:hypothetical protein
VKIVDFIGKSIYELLKKKKKQLITGRPGWFLSHTDSIKKVSCNGTNSIGGGKWRNKGEGSTGGGLGGQFDYPDNNTMVLRRPWMSLWAALQTAPRRLH